MANHCGYGCGRLVSDNKKHCARCIGYVKPASTAPPAREGKGSRKERRVGRAVRK